MLTLPHQDTLLMLKPSIVLTSLTKPLHAACCLLPTNVNVWMMVTFIRVTLVELCRLQDELPRWAEQNWFTSWREDGTLCLRGFFSVYSNYGTELSPLLLLSVVICFLLHSLEDWCRHNYFWEQPPVPSVLAAAPAAQKRKEQTFITGTKMCEYI